MQLLTLMILGVYILTLVRRRNVIYPSAIFIIIILGTMFITGLKLAKYQSDYPPSFYVLIYLSVLLFCAGHRFFGRRLKYVKVEMSSIVKGMEQYNQTTMKRVIVILWLGIMIAVSVTIFVLGPPPAISLCDRSQYFLSGWGTIYLGSLVLFVLLLFDRYQKQSISSGCYFLCIITLVGTNFLMANKTQIFSLVIAYVVVRTLLYKGQSLKMFFVMTVIILGIFIAMYVLLYEKMYNFTSEDTLRYYYLNLPAKYSFLGNPYLYISTNFENLYHYMHTPHHLMYGYCSLYNLIRSFPVCDFLFDETISSCYLEFRQSIPMKAMTTGSIFFNAYRDFGILGMLGYSFICGSICGRIERKLIDNKTFSTFFAYCYAMIAVFLSFFTDLFLAKSMIINLIVAWIVSKFIHGNIVVCFRKRRCS